MKQFKSLLTRDISINKWGLLLPIFVVVASYLFILFIDIVWGIDLDAISYKMEGANVPFIGLIGVVLQNLWLSGVLLLAYPHFFMKT